MKTLKDFNFQNKKAIIRVDFNVPLNNQFEVTDATRIEAAKSTIIKVLEDGGSCVLMSHLGRPKGKQEEFSLKHIVAKVKEILGVNVKFVEDCIGEKAEEAVANLENGEILLLENLRFFDEEKTTISLGKTSREKIIGLPSLENYRKEYDEKREVFVGRPLHNWASHGAKAFETMAISHEFGASGRSDLQSAFG